VAERVRVREIDDDEGGRLVPIMRRGSESVVTWRRVPDGAAVGAGHGRARDREGGVGGCPFGLSTRSGATVTPRAKSPVTHKTRPDRRRPGGNRGRTAWRAGGRGEERLAEEDAGKRGDLGGGQADRGEDGHLGGQYFRSARLGGEGCPGRASGGVPGADDQDPGDAGQERAAEVRVVGLRCRSG
jgi:hypothetical protein